MSKSEDNTRSTKSTVGKNVPAFNKNAVELKNLRIIQKNLVYVIGLSIHLANKETLSKLEYFGQYGSITKIVVNKNKAYNPTRPNGPSYSAYISYSSAKEASLAILSIDNVEAEEHIIRASFGTTKYCTNFLKNLDCPNKECLYLHSEAHESDIISRDDMSGNKNIFYEQQLLAMRLADIFNENVKKNLSAPKKFKAVFPSTEKIYEKQIVIDKDPTIKFSSKRFDSDDCYKNYKNSYYYDHKQNSKLKKHYADDFNSNYENYYESYDNLTETYENYEYEYVLVKDNKKRIYNSSKKSNIKTQNKKEKLSNNICKINMNYTKSESDSSNKNQENDQSQIISNSDYKLNEKGINLSLNDSENKSGENSTTSNTDDSKNENNLNLNIINSPESVSSDKIEKNLQIKNIYRRREISRFGFVNKNKSEINYQNNSENVSNMDIPNYVSDMLYKKISSYTFFKKFTCVKDKKKDMMYFEKDLNENNDDSWAQFIKSNVSIINETHESLLS